MLGHMIKSNVILSFLLVIEFKIININKINQYKSYGPCYTVE